MDFTNEFDVPAPLPLVWDFMLDAQEVAPCVPGAQITEVIDETHYRGTVKVKLGAVQVTYRGELELRADKAQRTIILQGRGSEARGSGGASGTFTTTMSEGEGGLTHVHIASHVDVTGRVAQFGRGIMQDVANRLIKEFASCLEAKIGTRSQAAGRTGESSATPSGREAAPGPVAPRASTQRPDQTPAPTPTPSLAPSELRIADLLLDVARSRLAAGLRVLADLVEPK